MAATDKGAKGRAGKAKAALQAVTANRLTDGIVVFLAEGNHWSERSGEAQIARDQTAADALLATAEVDVTRRIVVAPYLIEMTETPAGWVPGSLRERIRAAGPTIRLDLGKQAEKDAPHVSL